MVLFFGLAFFLLLCPPPSGNFSADALVQMVSAGAARRILFLVNRPVKKGISKFTFLIFLWSKFFPLKRYS